MNHPYTRQIDAAIKDCGIRVLVRNGWELLAVITGERINDSAAVQMLRKDGVIDDHPVTVLDKAHLDYRVPLAIMPCSNVSGMTARLIYGDATHSASRIYGRPPICTQGGVVHLREFTVGPMELPSDGEAQLGLASEPDTETMEFDGYRRVAR